MQNIEKLKPTGLFTNYIYKAIPLAFDESMSYYETLCGLLDYLKNTVIPTVNNNADAMIELQNLYTELHDYIEHYFDNLDVQEEINNKLDDMAESGQLTDIIAQYLGLAGMITFNNINEMKLAENLVNGSKCATLGYENANDGGNALYRIRYVTNDDVVDNMFIIELYDDLLVAELIHEKEINVLQLGIKKDGLTDNSTKLQTIINTINDGTLYFPKGKYIFNTNIDCNNKQINFKGDFDYTYIGTSEYGLCFDGINGFINTGRIYFDRLLIQDTTLSHTGDGIRTNGGTRISKCCFVGFENAINANYHSIVAENNNMHYNNRGVYRPIDARIINNTINANELDGIYLDQGCNDNIVSNNKIEWNKRHGIALYKAVNNVISNNIIDRQTEYGISLNQCGKNIINGNYLRRNNTNTTVGVNQCQVKIESCNDLIFSNNNLSKGNSQDDGTGDEIPVYAMYIVYSHDLLFMGNDFINSCTQTNPINIYQGGSNIQFFDLGFNIPSLLTGNVVSGSVNSTTPLTLQVAGTKAGTGGWPEIDKFKYEVRRTDMGFYEAGYIELTNSALWGSDSSTSAKSSKAKIANETVDVSVTFDRTTSKYSVTFTSPNNYGIRLYPIYI